MFVYPGNVRLLCITDDVSIFVKLPLSSVPETGTCRFTDVMEMSVIYFDSLSDDENRLNKILLGNKSKSEL